jgi:hypothetical protein
MGKRIVQRRNQMLETNAPRMETVKYERLGLKVLLERNDSDPF